MGSNSRPSSSGGSSGFSWRPSYSRTTRTSTSVSRPAPPPPPVPVPAKNTQPEVNFSQGGGFFSTMAATVVGNVIANSLLRLHAQSSPVAPKPSSESSDEINNFTSTPITEESSWAKPLMALGAIGVGTLLLLRRRKPLLPR